MSMYINSWALCFDAITLFYIDNGDCVYRNV